MYKIGELSKLSQIPVNTLRYYDNEGILPPDFIDESTGYRYYRAARLSDCYRILVLKELGFSLCRIKEIFSLPKENISELIETKRQELYRLEEQTANRIKLLESLHKALKGETAMFDIVIRKSEDIRLLYDRRIISNQSECSGRLDAIRRTIPREIVGSRMVIIDYETEFVQENWDMGFGIEITGKAPKQTAFAEKILHFQGDTANLVCTEEEYADAFRALNQYVLDNEYQIVGPTYKIIYEDHTMEIKLPVVKLSGFNADYNEDMDVPFVNDEAAVGRWERFDCLPCREMFHPQKQKSANTNDLVKELYFLPNGERYWCFGWTKGLLLSHCGYPHRKSQNPYTIEKIGKDTFMFIEFKTYLYFEGGKPEVWVFKKTDSKAYRKKDIMMVDKIPDCPPNDSAVVGVWEVCDLVRTVETFDPHHRGTAIPYDGLFWRKAEFMEGGRLFNSFKNEDDGHIYRDGEGVWRWITGYVICNPRSTASRYVIQKREDADYLFIQWKSGDYSFGGGEPFWYVFRR